jgi:S1-C subfamily serine protease
MSGPVGISEKIIQISAPVWLGNSGGGAFDEDGRLIGICSWISKNGPQLTFFVHRDAINKFIVDNVTNF